MSLLLDVGEPTAEPGSSRNLREIHLDFLLLEELETNLDFARYLFGIAFAPEELPEGLPESVRAQHGVWDAGGENCALDALGENDLDVTATWVSGGERRLIIEDKVRAGFQIDQARRYRDRARSQTHTRCLLIAPLSFITNHPKEVQFFGERGAAVTIEDLARELESGAPRVGMLRPTWRSAVLRDLTVRLPPPDHPPTVAFSAWCVDWLSGWALSVEPISIRTVNDGWIHFKIPDGLIYKCSHGWVDLQVNHFGPDRGMDDVNRRVGGSLPAGFRVDVNKTKHTVLRYSCERVSPQDGVGLGGEPIRASGIKDALAACVTITRWLEESGGRRLLGEELTDDSRPGARLGIAVADPVSTSFGSASSRPDGTVGALRVAGETNKGASLTLLGHLTATRAEVFLQAEVLCTISLAWILGRSDEAGRAFGQLVGIDRGLAWTAEDLASGVVGRPDVVGRVAGEGPPRIIVEAKLGAPLDQGQLRAYGLGGCRVAVLVPQARVGVTRRTLDQWGLDVVSVLSWDRALDAIGAAVAGSACAADVAQLTDMYRHVERTWVPPFSATELDDPAAREADRVKLAEQVSALLHDSIIRARGSVANMLPMQRSRYRYVSMEPGAPTATHVAIGVFDGLDHGPLAMRWHNATGGFADVVARLKASDVELKRDGGHVYVPLHVPPESGHGEMVDALFTQVCDVIHVSTPELRPLQ